MLRRFIREERRPGSSPPDRELLSSEQLRPPHSTRVVISAECRGFSPGVSRYRRSFLNLFGSGRTGTRDDLFWITRADDRTAFARKLCELRKIASNSRIYEAFHYLYVALFSLPFIHMRVRIDSNYIDIYLFLVKYVFFFQN